ncbi:MAG: hypothetical protein WCG29_06765 [Desulfomonile sp.]|jgi:predicted tellurium resistance membrane protein TerC|nr:hypothetical protein [Deltaproteobacteria bacterium]
MLRKIFTSNEFAVLVLLIAAMSLVMLYLSGRTIETAIGTVLLALAALLIFRGDKKKDSDTQ